MRSLSRWLGAKESMTHIVRGNPAPKFTLKDLDGKQYSLAQALEKGPVVLTFFKVSCPVCKFTLPFVERLAERYGEAGVTFMAVSQDNAGASREFAQTYGLQFPVLVDEAGYPVSNAYGLSMVPTVFLIEPDGTVSVSSMGFNKSDLETIAGELANRQKLAHEPVFRPDESVPVLRPG